MSKRSLVLLAVALVVAGATVGFYRSSWGTAIEMRFLDLWFNCRGPVPPPSDIVVVAMNEESYRTLEFPLNQAWPRSAHVRLLHRLKEAGARRVVFDVLFLDPGPDPEVDRQLADAINGVPTVLGGDYEFVDKEVFRGQTLLTPLPAFATNAAATGLVNLPADGEFVRNFPTVNLQTVTLAEAAVDHSTKPGRCDFLNYYGPAGTITTYSYYQVLEPSFPLNFLRDKIVFVGLSLRTEVGPAQKDAYLTAFGRTYGVELQATAAANLRDRGWIRRAPVGRELINLVALALVSALLVLWFRPLMGAGLWLILAGGWSLLAYWLFRRQVFVPGASLMFVVLPVVFLGSTVYYYIVTRRQQRQLERAFRFYLSPQMAREVARNPAALKLGGQQVEATAMFTDIADFTALAESMPPDEVARMLNAYFTEVMDAVFEKQGTLVKFIGDAVFAIWGAPLQTPHHARLACEAALEIQHDIQRFNDTGRFPPLRTRIGIHTGPMIVGNLGSARRFDFTAVGDAVNFASRLEGLNKHFGTDLLISAATRNTWGETATTVRIGLVQVTGKKIAVPVYTVLSPATTAADWHRALVDFGARRWDEAAATFAHVGNHEPRLQKAATFYCQQIAILRGERLEDQWQGEISFSTK